MRPVTALLASAMLFGEMAVGNAQNTSPPLPNQTPTDQNQGAERNPNATPGGSKTHPSPPNADRAGAARTAPLDQGNANQGTTTGAGGLNQSYPGYTPRAASSCLHGRTARLRAGWFHAAAHRNLGALRSNRRAIDALVLRNSGKPVPLQSVNFAKAPCEADGPSDESAFTRVFDALCRGRRG